MEFLNDIVYANFSQLSYFDWHKYSGKVNFENKKFVKGPSISTIFEDADNYSSILTPRYTSNTRIKKIENDYVSCQEEDHKTGKPVNIYDYDDYRMFLLYSEERNEPNKHPKFKDCGLGDWEFVCGHNHFSIVAKMKNNLTINKFWDSGFQASAFKKGNDVIIAYRGSDDMFSLGHFLSDWTYTNLLNLAFDGIPDSLTCAGWFYEEVKSLTGKEYLVAKGSKEILSQPNIHITGHSMGGALAQYVAVCSGKKHPTVTWNSLGIGYKNKNCNRTEEISHYKKYYENYKNYDEKAEYSDSIKNYFIYNDLTANLQKRVGRIICVDKETPKYDKQWDFIKVNNGIKIKKSYKDNVYYLLSKIAEMTQADGINDILKAARQSMQFPKRTFDACHWVTNFIALMDNNGKINPMNFRESFKKNVIKSTMIETGYIPDVFGKHKESSLKNLPLFYSLSEKQIYSIPASRSKINNPNIFYNNTPDWIKNYDKKWYDKTTLEMGSFNNAQYMAGVRGGVPYIFKKTKLTNEKVKADQKKNSLVKKEGKK